MGHWLSAIGNSANRSRLESWEWFGDSPVESRKNREPQFTKMTDAHPTAEDPFNLARFVSAQQSTFSSALTELTRGQKESHWMWFIFPQIDGLGSSRTAKVYAIKSRDEAVAYLRHPLLAQRLVQCCQALLRVEGKSASEVMGYPDDLKLRSSLTLFSSISERDSIFQRVLDKYFQGRADQRTLDILAKEHRAG